MRFEGAFFVARVAGVELSCVENIEKEVLV